MSDLHVGSAAPGRQKSCDLGPDAQDRFIDWLYTIGHEAGSRPFDIVIAGDFLDFWQARVISGPDTYRRRLLDIHESNMRFFAKISGFLQGEVRSNRDCSLYYVVGNHDDPLAFLPYFDATADPRYSSDTCGTLRSLALSMLGPRVHIVPFYHNADLRLRVEHGHLVEDGGDNTRLPDGTAARSQRFSEFVNEMQDREPDYFDHIEYLPNEEVLRYLQYLRQNPPRGLDASRVCKAIDDMRSEAMRMHGLLAVLVEVLLPGPVVNRIIGEQMSASRMRAGLYNNAMCLANDPACPAKIVVLGHTHIEDLVPSPGADTALYANCGTWMDSVRFHQMDGRGLLKPSPSNLPYVKVSATDEPRVARLELRYFSGRKRSRATEVLL